MNTVCVNGHPMQPTWKVCLECGSERAYDDRSLEERVDALEKAVLEMGNLFDQLKAETAAMIGDAMKAAATPGKKDDAGVSKRLWEWMNTPIGRSKKKEK